MDPDYIESVWWSLKQIFDKGLLVEDYRVAPWCPRCGTGLSDHELAQGYETVVDPSVYVRFPLTSGPLAGEAALLVWTTTPWTLVSNTAVAVHPDVTYVVATDGSEQLVVAEPLLEQGARRGLGGDRAALHRHARWSAGPTSARSTWSRSDGRALRGPRGLRHHRGRHRPGAPGARVRRGRPAHLPRATACRWSTRSAPTAPSRRTCRWSAASSSRRPTRRSSPTSTRAACCFRHVPYEHSYPHCWRCHTALLYYAQPSWYIRTTAVKDALLRENERTNWYPETVKHGRYGDWLNNNVDWALSRNRYWGTPLPIWRCEEGHLTCVGSLAELSELTGTRPVRRWTRTARSSTRSPSPARTRLRADGDAGARGHRRLVRLGRDAVRPVGLPVPERGAVREALPGAVHLRGDRPDPRLVLHADGRRHAGLRPVVVRERRLPRATSWPRTAARCPSTWATSSSRSR